MFREVRENNGMSRQRNEMVGRLSKIGYFDNRCETLDSNNSNAIVNYLVKLQSQPWQSQWLVNKLTIALELFVFICANTHNAATINHFTGISMSLTLCVAPFNLLLQLSWDNDFAS